ncbi:MAG TPA: winged helix-turn-helix transcriptional regulator [Candidatus Krumholzibacteria bacterium]|nr:winged helix-turn-helix transcriptional regulator [Candidatus Krumholzibacteria bacterium]
MHEAIEALSDTRREILLHIKHRGGATIAELAAHLGISDEGTRQHLIYLEHSGWVVRRDARDPSGRSGRPASVYHVSPNGEVFFPKQYEQLTVSLMDAVNKLYGNEAVRAALTQMTDARVADWAKRLEGKSLAQKIELLKNYYREGDEFATAPRGGELTIVERNCPFLNVANARPALCSTTVSVLTRLLGFQVERRMTFQHGDGCCEFVIHTDRPVNGTEFKFEFEPALAGPDR